MKKMFEILKTIKQESEAPTNDPILDIDGLELLHAVRLGFVKPNDQEAKYELTVEGSSFYKELEILSPLFT